MSGFYKMDPAAWDFGTAELSLEEEAAYLRIVNAIHKHDGPVPNIDRVLAGMFRCSTRKARALVGALVAAGKITIEGGAIWNDRARSDLVHRQVISNSSAERGAKGGRSRSERAAKAMESNDTTQAVASSRIEENRIEVAVAVGRERAPENLPAIADEGPDIGSLLARVMAAVGLNPNDIPSAHWMPNVAEMHILGWINAGIPPDAIERVATESRQRHRDPPNGPKALDAAMRAWLTAQSAPAFTAPTGPVVPFPGAAPQPPGNRPHRMLTAEEFQAAVNRGFSGQ